MLDKSASPRYTVNVKSLDMILQQIPADPTNSRLCPKCGGRKTREAPYCDACADVEYRLWPSGHPGHIPYRDITIRKDLQSAGLL